MYKPLLVLICLLTFSVILSAQPAIQISNLDGSEVDINNICQDKSIKLESSYTQPNIKQFNWRINGKPIYNTSTYILSGEDLLGAVSVLSEVIYIDKKYRKVGKKKELCEITCIAWNTIMINIVPCKKIKTCPSIPTIKLKASTLEYKSNEPIYLVVDASEDDYGKTDLKWINSSGRLEITSKTTATLYPDLASEISVTALFTTSYRNCEAEDKVVLTKIVPQLKENVKISTCTLKNSRIDNVCKAKLKDVIDIFHTNLGKSITIRYSDKVAAEGAKKVLTSGTLGVNIDSYKVALEFDRNSYKNLLFVIKY